MIFSTNKQEANNCCTPQPQGKIECPICHTKASAGYCFGDTTKAIKEIVFEIQEN